MMSKQEKKAKIFLQITVILFAVSFFSLSFIPFMDSSDESTQRILSNIIAALFWLGLIAGIIFNCITNRVIRKNSKKAVKKVFNKQKFPGAITFSSNMKHLIIYGVILIGVVIMISDIALSWVASYIMFPVISLTLFLFTVHCIIDGKNYKIYMNAKEGVSNE